MAASNRLPMHHPALCLCFSAVVLVAQIAHAKPTAAYKHVQRYAGGLHLDATNGTSHYARINSFSKVPPVSNLVGRPYCPRLSWNTPLDGSWYQDTAGHYAYELDACRLRRLSSADALRCITNTGRIEFVGDSLTRYQFVSLIYFLTAGHYQHPYDDSHHSITWSHQWPSWEDYYDGVTALLQERLAPAGGAVSNTRTHGPDERWTFQLPRPAALDAAAAAGKARKGGGRAEGAGDDARLALRRSLMASAAAAKAAGSITSAASSAGGGGSVHFSYIRDANAWQALALGLLDEIAKRRGAPALLLLNPGISSLPEAEEDVGSVMAGVDAILQRGVKLFRSGAPGAGSGEQQPTLAWKTHTMGNWDAVQGLLLADAGKRGWVEFDLRTITRAMERQRLMLYIEPGGNKHFLAVVYEQFNDVLLNILCE